MSARRRAVDHDTRAALGQVGVDGKTSDISRFRLLLEGIERVGVDLAAQRVRS